MFRQADFEVRGDQGKKGGRLELTGYRACSQAQLTPAGLMRAATPRVGHASTDKNITPTSKYRDEDSAPDTR